MAKLPRASEFDSTAALLREGYRYVARRCEALESDIFETRLMLRPVRCARGEAAARMFYTPGRFTRNGAIPPTTLRLLQDRGSVQTLDGAAHSHRKALFMSLMTREAIGRLTALYAEEWRHAAERWRAAGEIGFHAEVQEVLCRAVCRWAGLPLGSDEARKRTREFAAMIDGAGAFGIRNVRGQLLRARTERWARQMIERVRSGETAVPPGSAVAAIAQHLDPSASKLETSVAAVELLNVLRPTVAVARFIVFAALALHEHPEARPAVGPADEEALECFVQEVRRFYPFFPFVGGRALTDFEWNAIHFPRGTWVLLDLYGTNHDPRSWPQPGAFRPERFRDWDGNAFNLIPQGAGDVNQSHRCPGERITLELMKESVRQLISGLDYEVPEQDLAISLRRFPAIPASGLRLRVK